MFEMDFISQGDRLDKRRNPPGAPGVWILTRYSVRSVDQSRRLHLHHQLEPGPAVGAKTAQYKPIVFISPSLGQTQRSGDQLNYFEPDEYQEYQAGSRSGWAQTSFPFSLSSLSP